MTIQKRNTNDISSLGKWRYGYKTRITKYSSMDKNCTCSVSCSFFHVTSLGQRPLSESRVIICMYDNLHLRGIFFLKRQHCRRLDILKKKSAQLLFHYTLSSIHGHYARKEGKLISQSHSRPKQNYFL